MTVLRVWILLLGLGALTSHSSFAGVQCLPGGGGRTIFSSVCGGRQIPLNKTREFRNLRLVCSSNSSHHVRYYKPLPEKEMEEWRTLDFSIDDEEEIRALGADKVQAIRRQMQSLWQNTAHKEEWSGSIPYETVEVWDWTACEYGPDRSACGVTVKQVYRGKDKDGNSVYDTVEEVNSCWHTEDYTERRQCSVEQMNFTAKFRRPSTAEWSPPLNRSTEKRGEGYYDIIPNKYDLLPGEVEDVQIYNTGGTFLSGGADVMSPKIEIGDAWNVYDTTDIRALNGPLVCRMNTTYAIDAQIETIKRRIDKKTPNAFRSPVDEFGRQIQPIRWLEVQGRSGKYLKEGEPERILLSDASAVIIGAMANQSRKFSEDIEKAKAEVDREQRSVKEAEVQKQNLASPPKKTVAEKDKRKKFHRNTLVRVKLYEKVPWGRSILRTQEVIWSSGEMQLPGRVGQYEIRLGSQDPEKNAFKSKANYGLDTFLGSFPFNYRPNRNYFYEVSMFQEGVDFYIQEDGMFTDRFSKPLPLAFTIQDIKDARAMWQRIVDFQGQRKALFWFK